MGHEIDYQGLVDRLIKDFRPVRRLWPPSLRLACWILLEISILAVCAESRDLFPPILLLQLVVHSLGFASLILISIGAAYLALRSAIPERHATPAELLLLATVFIAALIVQGAPSSVTPPAVPTALLQVLGLSALPWVALFWAVRRGAPVHPMQSGGLIGLAAFWFALAARHFLAPSGGFTHPRAWLLIGGCLVTALSSLAGALLLKLTSRWQAESSTEARPNRWALLDARFTFPVAGGVASALLIAVLKLGPGSFRPVTEFDFAIRTYEESLTGFRANVPSSSIEAVLTAYIDDGMPSYMWDFGPAGFKLVGGRFEHLPSGAPATYTWFRGNKVGVMCVFMQTNGFEVPAMPHQEHRHLLFYEYKGFSICLLDVSGYGNFTGIIAAPLPLKQFESLVLAAVP